MNRKKKAQESPAEREKIVLQKGDTFWRLAEIKYHGKHPIDAIFEVNGLTPSVVYENGRRVLLDPIYYAGTEYILPGSSELDSLSKRFWKKIDEEFPALENMDEVIVLNPSEPVADASRRAAVTLNWDDTLWALARPLYGDDVPVDAIYELNGLKPREVTEAGMKRSLPPIYHGGRTYLLPALSEIAELTERYRSRL